MKQITVLILGVILLVSCEKEYSSKWKNQYSGRWEYIRFVGYPFNSPSLPPGNGKIIVLGHNGSFERRNHDSIIFKGQYFLEERKDCHGDEKKIFFKTTDSLFGESSSISIKGDSLFMSSSNCLQDGGSSIYRRL